MSKATCTFCRGVGRLRVPFGLGLCVQCAHRCRIEVDAVGNDARLYLVCDNEERRYLVAVRAGASDAAVATYEAALRAICGDRTSPTQHASRVGIA